MKGFKVGDIVAAKLKTGKITKITAQEFAIEVPDAKSVGGARVVLLTSEQAQLRGLTLEQLVNEYLVKVEIKK